jgi:hypothetical protein
VIKWRLRLIQSRLEAQILEKFAGMSNTYFPNNHQRRIIAVA